MNKQYDPKDGWFLPSKEILKEMYTQLYKKGICSFTNNEYYWSSSPCGSNMAWYQSFTPGYHSTNYRHYYNYGVRAVRVFDVKNNPQLSVEFDEVKYEVAPTDLDRRMTYDEAVAYFTISGKISKKDLLARIEKLEQRIKELEVKK